MFAFRTHRTRSIASGTRNEPHLRIGNKERNHAEESSARDYVWGRRNSDCPAVVVGAHFVCGRADKNPCGRAMSKPALWALGIGFALLVLNPQGTKNFVIESVVILIRTLVDVFCRLAT